MFIKKPLVATVSFVGAGLLILFSSYFTLSFINNLLVKAIVESLGLIFCLMTMVVGAIYLAMKQEKKQVDKPFQAVTRLPLKDTKSAKQSMTMTG